MLFQISTKAVVAEAEVEVAVAVAVVVAVEPLKKVSALSIAKMYIGISIIDHVQGF